ncbi:MAG: alanine--tRNA ligase [bacterium]|nr:alanine--tRNA ligase [bacterium]
MTSQELKKLYLDFFVSKGHKILPNVSLVPENDPTALFISAGMHPLVPYLIGENHPQGKRLVSVQKCLRTDDIDEVGDKVHHTFFEMLGNWSLGDLASPDGGQGGYWKKEAIEWSFEFLTSKEFLGIKKEKLAVSVFAGDGDAPFDQESYDVWKSLGILEERITRLPKENNWWGPVGETGPTGPDTEMFVWTGSGDAPAKFDSEDSNWVEIWNDVFMQYNKTKEGKYEPLKQKNVDTGMGVERTLAVLNGLDDDYKTDLFWPIVQKIEEISGKKYEESSREFRIIADHLRASVFLVYDGVETLNKGRGYILRRLIRRAIVQTTILNIVDVDDLIRDIILAFRRIMSPVYQELKDKEVEIIKKIQNEAGKFNPVVTRGLKEFNKIEKLDGVAAFNLFQTYGFPWELTLELAKEKGIEVINKEDFEKEFEKHQELSRSASAGMFKGGLDHSEKVTKYHTSTHLLQAALRQVLGDHVQQKGSNLTSERLRFDFSHPQKMDENQIKQVEDLVNQKIDENLPITMKIMTLDEAKNKGALAFFSQKYEDKVKVYSIGDFSKEVCGGPHVDFTGKLGRFKIIKEEAAGAGVRRLYATLT